MHVEEIMTTSPTLSEGISRVFHRGPFITVKSVLVSLIPSIFTIIQPRISNMSDSIEIKAEEIPNG